MTPLEREMRICAEYLKCPHLEFMSLPASEKEKWLLYEEMQRSRDDYFYRKQEAKIAEQTDKMQKNRGI
jgi:hypothetical protein